MDLKHELYKINMKGSTLAALLKVAKTTVSSHSNTLNSDKLQSNVHKTTYKYFFACRNKQAYKNSFTSLDLTKKMRMLNISAKSLGQILAIHPGTVSGHCTGSVNLSKFHGAMYFFYFQYLKEQKEFGDNLTAFPEVGGIPAIEKSGLIEEDCINFLKETGKYEIYRIEQTKTLV